KHRLKRHSVVDLGESAANSLELLGAGGSRRSRFAHVWSGGRGRPERERALPFPSTYHHRQHQGADSDGNARKEIAQEVEATRLRSHQDLLAVLRHKSVEDLLRRLAVVVQRYDFAVKLGRVGAGEIGGAAG